MAGGVVVPDGVSAVDYGGGLTLSVFMTCLVAASGGLIFGYDIGISGASHPPLDFSCAKGSPRAWWAVQFSFTGQGEHLGSVLASLSQIALVHLL